MSIRFVAGKHRPIAVQFVSRVSEVTEAPPFPKKGYTQDIADPIQGSGCSGVAGRLLSEPCGLVRSERAQRRSRQLCLFVECLHQPG